MSWSIVIHVQLIQCPNSRRGWHLNKQQGVYITWQLRYELKFIKLQTFKCWLNTIAPYHLTKKHLPQYSSNQCIYMPQSKIYYNQRKIYEVETMQAWLSYSCTVSPCFTWLSADCRVGLYGGTQAWVVRGLAMPLTILSIKAYARRSLLFYESLIFSFYIYWELS